MNLIKAVRQSNDDPNVLNMDEFNDEHSRLFAIYSAADSGMNKVLKHVLEPLVKKEEIFLKALDMVAVIGFMKKDLVHIRTTTELLFTFLKKDSVDTQPETLIKKWEARINIEDYRLFKHKHLHNLLALYLKCGAAGFKDDQNDLMAAKLEEILEDGRLWVMPMIPSDIYVPLEKIIQEAPHSTPFKWIGSGDSFPWIWIIGTVICCGLLAGSFMLYKRSKFAKTAPNPRDENGSADTKFDIEDQYEHEKP